MARPSGPKTRNNGRWTESKYNTFIRNILRSGSRKWQPLSDALKAARVSRGIYLCAGCGNHVEKSVKENGRRKNNVHVDHIAPVVNPDTGFVSWGEYIDRMFCEPEGLQVLCGPCHTTKTNEERAISSERRREEKNEL